MVDVSGLTYRYPQSTKLALDRLSIQIGRGQFFGLLGPNGAGKSTLISFLCGLIHADYQKAEVLETDQKNLFQVKRKIGYCPQEIALYPTLSIRENIDFFASLLSVDSNRVQAVLEWVGLLDKSKMTVSTCSGGIKRRLNLAVALLAEPELLILDEPTVGVDPQSRNFIFEKILELKKRGVTLIYSTHYLEEVKRLCDHVAIVMDGQVKTQGTLNQVLGQDKIEERFLEITGQELDRELVQ